MADFNNINTRENIPEITEQNVQVFPDRVIMDPDLNNGSVKPRQIGDPIRQEMVNPKLNNPDVQTTVTQATTNVSNQQTTVVPKEDPSISPAGSDTISGMRMLTPEEAAQLENTQMVKVGSEEGTFVKDDKEVTEIKNQATNELAQMMSEALEYEKESADNFQQLMENPEERAKVMQSDNTVDTTKVEYHAEYEQKPTTYRPTTQYENSTFDPDDLLPAYDDDVEETPAEATEEDATANIEDQLQTEEDYANYVRGLQTAETEYESILTTVKDRVTLIPSGRTNPNKTVDDSAFMSAINKFKRDNFRTVSVPLLNSGFCVDMVGTGAVDLNLLYSNTDDNTTRAEYEIEKMKITMRNVVGTTPKIPKDDLRNMIHFADYNMMAYAHVAATLKNIEMIQTCTDCGEDFRIVCKSSDMIINLDKIKDRANAIKNSLDPKEHSLMMMDQEFSADNGFTIILGHPSYAEYIQYSEEVRGMVDNFSSFEQTMFRRVATALPFIRTITLPNGIHTNTIRQKFMALGMLSDDDLTELMKRINEMSKNIITPEFGIKSVKCPRCGKVHTDIRYENLENMLFFHFTITRLMSSIEE